MKRQNSTKLPIVLESVFFPKKCVSCGSYLEPQYAQNLTSADHEKDSICDACRLNIVKNEPPHCNLCGVGKNDCICRGIPRAYDSVVAPFYYEGAIKEAIKRMKFSCNEGVGRFLGAHLRSSICANCFAKNFDILTCVPATGESVSKRGFNQSRVIAENLKLPKELFPNLRTDYGLLIKQSGGKTQHKLVANDRKKNAEKAYIMGKNRDVSGKDILLVDDILTTGATAEACARTLKMAGAKSVTVATPAITRIYKETT